MHVGAADGDAVDRGIARRAGRGDGGVGARAGSPRIRAVTGEREGDSREERARGWVLDSWAEFAFEREQIRCGIIFFSLVIYALVRSLQCMSSERLV